LCPDAPPVDVILLLDSSGSLGFSGWQDILLFARRYLVIANYSLTGTR
jgi:hypothetical protein